MFIGLHDAEYERMPKKTFPNYALMKISAWHKSQGDEVEMFIPINPEEPEQLSLFPQTEKYPPPRKASIYDRVYSSKVFDFTPINPYLPEDTIKGGTGYDKKLVLPQEIECCYPDYSIYPNCDYAIGFLTRGCPNKCNWCFVPEKEGQIRPYRDWEEVVRPDVKSLY